MPFDVLNKVPFTASLTNAPLQTITLVALRFKRQQFHTLWDKTTSGMNTYLISPPLGSIVRSGAVVLSRQSTSIQPTSERELGSESPNTVILGHIGKALDPSSVIQLLLQPSFTIAVWSRQEICASDSIKACGGDATITSRQY